MHDDWKTLTVNQQRYRGSPGYCGFVRTLNGMDLFNYYGFIGNLQLVCEHIAQIEQRDISYKTVKNRIERGISLEDAVSGEFYSMTKDNGDGRCKYKLTLDGRQYSLRELADLYDVKPNTLFQRLKRGWSVEEAVGVKSRNMKPRFYVVDGMVGTINELSSYFGIEPKIVRYRLRSHWDVSSAFKHPYRKKGRLCKETGTEISYEGERGTLLRMCKNHGFNTQSVYYRMNRYGLSKEDAFAMCVKAFG